MSERKKRLPTVAIEQEIYALAKDHAEAKGIPLVKFVNDMLLLNIEKDRFLRAYAPKLSFNGIASDGSSLFIRDERLDRTAQVFLRDGHLYCDVDNRQDCEHIHFALALPEVARLNLKKPLKK